MKYALIHANVFDGKDLEIKNNQTLLINDEKIERIIDQDTPIPDDYQMIDIDHHYVLPGLINLHAHLFGTGKPSKSLGGGKSQEALMKFVKTKLGHRVIDKMVQDHVQNALHSGVTTIRSSGDFVYSDVRIRNAINEGKIVGPRLLVPGPAITCVGGHGDGTFAYADNDPQKLVEYVQKNNQHGVNYIKICVTGGVMDAKVKGEPGVVKMNLEQTKAICQRAHELGYQVASHTESSAGIKIALEGGVDTIEHGSFLDDQLIALFQEKHAAFIVTTSPALPLARLSPDITKLNELCVYNSEVVLEGMIDGAKKALKNHIPVGLGTDASCPLVTSYNMWREIYYFSKLYDVSPAFALHTATYVNAKIAGILDETGSLEEGKSADIIVVEKNPLEDLQALKDIHMVIMKGQLISQPKVKRLDQVDAWLDSLAL